MSEETPVSGATANGRVYEKKPRPPCARCGKPTPTPHSKFCSWDCNVEWRREHPDVGGPPKKQRPACLRCGNPTKTMEAEYCSRECMYASRVGKGIGGRKPGQIKVRQPCAREGCDKRAKTMQTEFCSHACYSIAKIGSHNAGYVDPSTYPLCVECGVNRVKKPWRKCCSSSCSKRRDQRLSPAMQENARVVLAKGRGHPDQAIAARKTIANARAHIKPESRVAQGRKNVEDGTLSRAAFKWRRYDYKGVPMRSTYEVRFATLLDERGVKWNYEPLRVKYVHPKDGHAASYSPDFELPGFAVFVEVKSSYYAARDAVEIAAKIAACAARGVKVFLATEKDDWPALLDSFVVPQIVQPTVRPSV